MHLAATFDSPVSPLPRGKLVKRSFVQAIIDNPDLEVVTSTGGERRSARAIAVGDEIELRINVPFTFPFSYGLRSKIRTKGPFFATRLKDEHEIA